MYKTVGIDFTVETKGTVKKRKQKTPTGEYVTGWGFPFLQPSQMLQQYSVKHRGLVEV